jgi:hypothetical protein
MEVHTPSFEALARSSLPNVIGDKLPVGSRQSVDHFENAKIFFVSEFELWGEKPRPGGGSRAKLVR